MGGLQGLADKGHYFRPFDYGWLGLVGTHFLSNDIAKLLAERVSEGDHVIAHSHGSLIVMLAAEYGAKWGKVTLFSPVLRSDVQFPEGFEESHTVHNPYDKAILIAVFLRRMLPNSWFGHPLWGDMGRVGYTGVPKLKSLSVTISPLRELLLSLFALPLFIFLILVLSPLEGLWSIYQNIIRKRDASVRKVYLRSLGYWSATLALPFIAWIIIVLLCLY